MKQIKYKATINPSPLSYPKTHTFTSRIKASQWLLKQIDKQGLNPFFTTSIRQVFK